MYRLFLLLAISAISFIAQAQQPWVKNISRPYSIDHGLDGRHLSVWASHGRYYDNEKGYWKWQRPALFCTTEDLFTQTIVVPYLIPMLENAGAVVFTPRERDWQRNEVIVDNDDNNTLIQYQELNLKNPWSTGPQPGFAQHPGHYQDGENPFLAGTVRIAETTHNRSKASTVNYQPHIPEDGSYAVYVSYQTVPSSIDDAHYTVYHKGQKTEFHVNQQIGGSTWVYLGTFEFSEGCSDQNRVVVSNHSEQKGYVTTDAVRFGGGMGNIERGGDVSGLPRCLEGARYYAQWAGMPYEVYSSKQGTNDYGDDINVRSLMTNLLCGGSVYAPDSTGRKVPIELSLAVHSDAGHTDTGLGVYGSLTICTTRYGDSTLASGESREASNTLAAQLLENTTRDLQHKYGEWVARNLYDRNYSETRVPIVPSVILETMSHQNFGDMRLGQDPNFRFTLARSIYKTLLRYINQRHDEKSIIQPLTPDNFHIEFTDKEGEIKLSWRGIIDSQEPTAEPTGYVLYMAQNQGGFDNGTHLRGSSCTIRLVPNVLYSFRVTATNEGGQSFPTEVLSALYNPTANRTVLIVNGFHRLSSPAISNCGQGFSLADDIGVSYGRTAGWLGLQKVFDTCRINCEDSTGLGYSSSELAGMFIAGNDFNDVRRHAEALQLAGGYNILSTSAQAVENGEIPLGPDYATVDLLLGLERNDGHSLVAYKTFTPSLQAQLRGYTSTGGNLMVSGAYVGTDMQALEEQSFLSQVLKVRLDGVNTDDSDNIRGMGITFNFHRLLNEQHYAATQSDLLMPTCQEAFPALVYANETSAAVAYQGADYHAFTMGFPFECITDPQKRASIMRGIMNFLNNR
ncbi:MAG: N-acetylmuramoyl-L-alanine amidase [Prevotella sp.]|nr:N-acetylmuramoyl-L-alanine amidase [Prevotella sp.]